MTATPASADRSRSHPSGRLRQVVDVYSEHGLGGVLTLLRYYGVRAATLVGSGGRVCPACGWKGRDFRPMVLYADRSVRPHAICPGCGAWERHRAAIPVMRRLLAERLGGRKVDALHISPEECVAAVVRPYAASYRKSNYENPAPGELQLDLHDIALPADDVDLVVMSYVLSCTPDDRLAVRNLGRILRPGGMVMAIEPVTAHGRHHEWGARGRGGQWRTFGVEDVAARFAPLEVEAVDLLAGVGEEERHLRGLSSREYLLVLRKPT
jgi:SAM-dependent methyltransferase